MNWLIWRLYRKQFIVFGALLLLFAIFVVLTGNSLWDDYQKALSTCSLTNSCNNLSETLFQDYGAVLTTIVIVGLGMPFLLGIFLGVPLIAKEYEDGTNKLAWTQSVTRRKWLTVKVVWSLLFSALYGLAITLLIMWWARTENAVLEDQFTPAHFGTQGLMPIAYAIFATSLGIFLGAWFKKVLVSLAVTFGVLVVLQAGFTLFVRQYYQPSIVISAPLANEATPTSGLPDGANWLLSKNVVDKNNTVYDGFTQATMPKECEGLKPNEINACLNTLGFHAVTTYHPSDRYWKFQWIESGIYLTMSLIVIAATYRLVLRRDA